MAMTASDILRHPPERRHLRKAAYPNWPHPEPAERPVTEHIREAVTPTGSTTYGPGGCLLIDCSCGAEYSVPQGGDEGKAVDEAHRKHVAEAER